jgi:aldehyde dehydrogenase (NAD+)
MPTIEDILISMDYGPAQDGTKEAHVWLAAHQRRFGLFIDNRWSAPDEASLLPCIDPADGALLAELTQASALDVARAVDAARRAQPLWQALGGHRRARVLHALARLLQKHARLFAVLATLEQGKLLRETRECDLPQAARHFDHHAGWAQLQSEEFPDHRPVGVIGQIVAPGFAQLAWKIAPALACANTVVFKPSASTSLTALLFAELCQKAGVPAGVVNIITGDASVGQAIVSHPGIDMIAFSGSFEAGRAIRIASAGSGKKLILQLTAGVSFIVFDDADLDAAIEGWVDALCAGRGRLGVRLLVQESIAQRFLARARARSDRLRVGAALDKSVDISVLQNSVLQSDGPQQSAIESISFRTPQEAIRLANNLSDGFAASIWSESISLALAVAPEIKAGVIWINSVNLFDAACGVGGVGAAGFGREGGREGMLEYMTALADDGRPDLPPPAVAETASTPFSVSAPASDPFALDRTVKFYIGGQQVRADGGDSRAILGHDGAHLADIGVGSRKDIRNAVEAARKASGWAAASAYNRAQVLYYIAENLALRADEFGVRIGAMTGAPDPETEVACAIERLFHCAAWADKYDGLIHQPPVRALALALNLPLGVIGIVCPNEAPLLGLIALVAPAIALGNRVVVVPSQAHPLCAFDLAQVLATSDLPGGVVNFVSGCGIGNGNIDELAATLASHFDVDAIWRHDGSLAGCLEVERLAAQSMKRSWVGGARGCNWSSTAQGGARTVLAHASAVKNIWIPHGV